MQTKVQIPHNWWEKILLLGTMPRKTQSWASSWPCSVGTSHHSAVMPPRVYRQQNQRQGFSWANGSGDAQGGISSPRLANTW